MKTARKALMAALGAGLTGLGTAMLDGGLTLPEATVAGGLALVAGAATWWVRPGSAVQLTEKVEGV